MSSVASRSIFVQTYPGLKCLSESKLVLSELQKFGRIATFRNLRYDVTNKDHQTTTRNILAIFESPQSAEKAVKASPLYIPLPPSSRASVNPRLRDLQNSNKRNTNDQNQESGSQASRLPDDTNPLHPWTASDVARENSRPPDIRCVIDWSRHNHALSQQRNPYHSYFEVDDQSVQFRDLRHWTGTPDRGLADCLMGRKRPMGQGRRNNIDSVNRDLGVKSLWALYEEGLEKAKRNGAREPGTEGGSR